MSESNPSGDSFSFDAVEIAYDHPPCSFWDTISVVLRKVLPYLRKPCMTDGTTSSSAATWMYILVRLSMQDAVLLVA